MTTPRALGLLLVAGLLLWLAWPSTEPHWRSLEEWKPVKTYSAIGVIRRFGPDGRSVVIQHEAIPGYMAAMTMPFKVRKPEELAGLSAGDEIAFHLNVNADTHWVDNIVRTNSPRTQALTGAGGAAIRALKGISGPAPASGDSLAAEVAKASSKEPARNPLWDAPFTNELGQKTTLAQFQGQALAITFIFTRCPIPDYCPRLTKNFQEACKTLNAMPQAPTNWHFLTFSFDPAFDTPQVLRGYALGLGYDPQHWSFLTGAPDQLAEVEREAGLQVEPDGTGFNHNFRTLIVDAAGHLQITFPVSGDLSGQIVQEMLKAAAAK